MLFRKDALVRAYLHELLPNPADQAFVAQHVGHIVELPLDGTSYENGSQYLKIKQNQTGYYAVFLPRTPYGARVYRMNADDTWTAHRLPWALSGAQKACLWALGVAVLVFFLGVPMAGSDEYAAGTVAVVAAMIAFVAIFQFFFYPFWDRDPERGARTADAIIVSSVVHHALTVHEDNQRIERNVIDNDRILFEQREAERAREWETKEAAQWETRRRELIRELRGNGW